MRPVKNSQRRRRLRLIQAEGERSVQQFESAASALTNAADIVADRMDADASRRRLFVECRGKTDTKLRIEHPGAEPLTVLMDRPYLLIGSDPECDVILEHDEIAPRHGLLLWVDGQIFFCDLAPRSSRGSVKQHPPNGYWLSHEPAAIGPFQLRLDKPSSSPEPEYSPLDRSPGLMEDFPQFALQFQGVEQADNHWPVNRVVTMIGRGSQCKLRLNHPSMPIVQSCLVRTKNGCWLIDIIGTGTTGVNKHAITIAPIDIGDILHLGPFQVEVVTTVFNPRDFEPVARKTKSNPDNKKTPPASTPERADSPPDIPPAIVVESPVSQQVQKEPPNSERLKVEPFETAVSIAELPAAESPVVELPQVAARPTEPVPKKPAPTEIPLAELPQAESPAVQSAPAESPLVPDHPSMLDVSAPNQSIREASSLEGLNSMIGPAGSDRISGNPLLAILEPVFVTVSPSLKADPAVHAVPTVTPVPSAEVVPVVTPANRPPEFVREFVQAQQTNLVLMKTNLDQLKRQLDQASGRSNSKRTKTLLERSMNDCMSTHESMTETLGKLIEMIDNDSTMDN